MIIFDRTDIKTFYNYYEKLQKPVNEVHVNEIDFELPLECTGCRYREEIRFPNFEDFSLSLEEN